MTTYGNSSAPTAGTRTNGLAIAGLTCGIVGLFVANLILGPLAVVFGAVGLRHSPAKGGAGMAKAGIVLGVVDIVLYFVLLAVAASNGGVHWYVGG